MQPTPFGQVPAAAAIGYHQHQRQQPQRINSNPPSHESVAPNMTRRRLADAPYTHVHASNMNQQRHGESWVEVSSQPSDSYSSSNEDAIITEGLQLPPSQAKIRRRRRSQYNQSSENEGDFDDEDGYMSTGSSVAEFPSLNESVTTSSVESEDDDEDEEEEGEDDEEEEEEEQVVPVAGHLAPSMRPFPASRRFSREPPQPDHDAALRASLSTLLSCAAAARGLSKEQVEPVAVAPPPVRRSTGLQALTLMPDSQREAMLQTQTKTQTQVQMQTQAQAQGRQRRTSDPKVTQPGSPRSRKSSLSHHESPKTQRRSTAKKSHYGRSRAASQASPPVYALDISYVTLAVSAGALILVSAISFSAGYMLGKEVGKEAVLQDGIKQATLGRTGGRIVSRSVGSVGSSLRSITVA